MPDLRGAEIGGANGSANGGRANGGVNGRAHGRANGRANSGVRSLKPPLEEVIASTSCCGRCFYNIPQGTLIILMPGAMILVVGCLLTSLLYIDVSYGDDVRRTALLLVGLGALMTAAGVTFWLSMWRQQQRQRRRLTRKTAPPRDGCDGGGGGGDGGVCLVAVYHVPDRSPVAPAAGQPDMTDSTRAAVT